MIRQEDVVSLYYDLTRASSFTASNDSVQAQDEWSYSIDENSSNYWRLGYIYSLKGEVELALENLETSIEKNNTSVFRYLYDPGTKAAG